MRKEWSSQNWKLYRNREETEVTALSSKVADSLCEKLNSKEEFVFMRDCAKFRELMTQMGRYIFILYMARFFAKLNKI